MTKSKPSSDVKGRRDHYVPQAYLRGFIHPQRQGHPKPLWVLNVHRQEWSEKSPSQIGWERGFYDYAPESNPDATAEDAFRRLENDVPRIRDRIRERISKLDSAPGCAGGLRGHDGDTKSIIQDTGHLPDASILGRWAGRRRSGEELRDHANEDRDASTATGAEGIPLGLGLHEESPAPLHRR